jgi:hypothetical protein
LLVKECYLQGILEFNLYQYQFNSLKFKKRKLSKIYRINILNKLIISLHLMKRKFNIKIIKGKIRVDNMLVITVIFYNNNNINYNKINTVKVGCPEMKTLHMSLKIIILIVI